MPTVIVKHAASNKMQFEQCELMECQEHCFLKLLSFYWSQEFATQKNKHSIFDLDAPQT